MRNIFNEASGKQDEELIKAHCAMIYACQTLAARGVPQECFLKHITKVYQSVSDRVEYENIMRLREQLDTIIPDGFER